MLLTLPLIYGITLSTVGRGINGESSTDPCDPSNHIQLDQWKRSVAYSDTSDICDNNLGPGWFRIISHAGERMPTECPKFGFRCNTISPIYLNASVPQGESIYPDVGKTFERQALVAGTDGSCGAKSYNIQIKGCNGFFVYYLVQTSPCYSAYCFGDQLPCPEGLDSETGFGPDCNETADIVVSPYVTTRLRISEGLKNGNTFVFNKPVFECHADDLVDDYTYQTKWFINDKEIENAKKTDIPKAEMVLGEGLMLEEHWKGTFKPNMQVQCSIQVGGNGYTVYGKPHISETFFAGIKVKQLTDTEYTLKEGEQLQLEVQLTMPLACSWLKTRTPSQVRTIQDNQCTLVIMNGLPNYQTDNNQIKCKGGINDNNIVFEAQYCGVVFSHSDWDQPRSINLTGSPDGIVNTASRTVSLRLYNAVPPTEDLSYWTNITIPDTRLKILDDDTSTSGKVCKSTNDPHMRTTDGKTWELQAKKNGNQPGEYIMYKHDSLPIQISAYYKECRRGILCNCGVGVRRLTVTLWQIIAIQLIMDKRKRTDTEFRRFVMIAVLI